MVHGCTVYTGAETAAVSRGTSHVTTKAWMIFERRYEKLVTHLELHATRVQ